MTIKIFHTADIHIGMSFNSYPDWIKDSLREARSEVIETMVQIANDENCDLFVISGDLFDKTTGIDKSIQTTVAKHLSKFNGSCLAILPGNHDFQTEMVDLWKSFNSLVDDRVLFLSEERKYSLESFGLNAVIYPAPCHSKHSSENNLNWIREESIQEDIINIGIAHGSITGISPDLDNLYFNMDLKELEDIPMDLWLMGHTHITYPDNDIVRDLRVFNPGTPEPDGLDCKHEGFGWIIDIKDGKSVEAKRVKTGKYRFLDASFSLESIDDYRKIEDYIKEHNKNTIARISLKGTLDEEAYRYRLELVKEIEDKLAYLILEDSELKIRINADKIQKEFTKGSFPEQLLLSLQDDEEALQLAYEIISEVRK